MLTVSGWCDTDQDIPLIYGGVVTDGYVLHGAFTGQLEYPALGVLALLDLPFSAIADTILLPVTISIYYFRPEPYPELDSQEKR